MHEDLSMPLRKVRKFYQVTLPASLSKKFGIAEGDYVVMEETAEGILVKPVTVTTRVPAERLTPATPPCGPRKWRASAILRGVTSGRLASPRATASPLSSKERPISYDGSARMKMPCAIPSVPAGHHHDDLASRSRPADAPRS